MHVVVVQPTPNSTTFGWERGLERLGHRVTVVVESSKRQFGGRPGADILAIPNSRWSESLAARSDLFRLLVDAVPSAREVHTALAQLRPDVALVKADRARNMVIGRVLGRLGVPWVLWQEQLPPLSRRWRLARSFGIRPAAAFTVLDSRPGGVKEERAESSMGRISYVPYVAEASRSGRGPDVSVVRVLVVASFKNHRAKHQWSVISAAATAGLLDGSVRFTFSGQGNPSHEGYRRILDAARAEGAEGLVELRTKVPFNDMPALYASHDILVLPSVREQFGMAVIEGMAQGLPTIVSSAVGSIGCVVDGETGLVFPVGDEVALGQSLRRLVEDRALRARLGDGAARFAQEHLDAKDAARRILATIPGLAD